MSIQPSVRYDIQNDSIIGFHDAGNCEDNNFLKEAANSMLVFMVKGVNKPWKQPIGFFPLKNGVSAATLQNMILEMIYYLHRIKLRVMTVLKLRFKG